MSDKELLKVSVTKEDGTEVCPLFAGTLYAEGPLNSQHNTIVRNKKDNEFGDVTCLNKKDGCHGQCLRARLADERRSKSVISEITQEVYGPKKRS